MSAACEGCVCSPALLLNWKLNAQKWQNTQKTFYRHRLAAISSAIQRTDAQTVLRLATDLALSTVT